MPSKFEFNKGKMVPYPSGIKCKSLEEQSG